MTKEVLVIIGAGGMGVAIGRRLGVGKSVVVADFSDQVLAAAEEALKGDGFDVHALKVDVSARDSVAALAAAVAELGPVTKVAHTAGLSPVQASVEAILKVDLYGVGVSLDEFGKVVAPGGAGVVIASMAGHMAPPPTAEQVGAVIASTPEQLVAQPFLQPDAIPDPGAAYSIAKQLNRFQVAAAAHAWGQRGARINSISPGVISTPMGQAELSGPSGAGMRYMIQNSGTARIGTPEDIANAVAFLCSPEGSFLTGTDLLVDGGVVAALRTGRIDFSQLRPQG